MRSRADLEAGLEAIRQSPADGGELRLIVRRPVANERETLAVAELDLVAGLVGGFFEAGLASAASAVGVGAGDSAALTAEPSPEPPPPPQAASIVATTAMLAALPNPMHCLITRFRN